MEIGCQKNVFFLSVHTWKANAKKICLFLLYLFFNLIEFLQEKNYSNTIIIFAEVEVRK